MKKILFILSVLVVALVLTGCDPTTGDVEPRPLVESFEIPGIIDDSYKGTWFGTSYNTQEALDELLQRVLRDEESIEITDGQFDGVLNSIGLTVKTETSLFSIIERFDDDTSTIKAYMTQQGLSYIGTIYLSKEGDFTVDCYRLTNSTTLERVFREASWIGI